MKKILLSIIAIATIIFSVEAQTKRNNTEKQNHTEKEGNAKMGHRKHSRKMGHHNMDDKLNLTEAQREQMKSINRDFKNKMQELKKNDNMTVKEYNAKKEALMQQRKQKTQALLTREQKNQMKQFKKESGKRGIESGKNGKNAN